MFDNNKNIKVGRDINLNYNSNFYEQKEIKELMTDKSSSKIILDQEFKLKLKKTIKNFIFVIVAFVILYFSLPLLFKYLSQINESKLFSKLFEVEIDTKTQILFTAVIAIFPVFNRFFDLWKNNEVEKKHIDILKNIEIILKEREHLKKK
jgi:uncharacterized membrane protein (DUF485 family)